MTTDSDRNFIKYENISIIIRFRECFYLYRLCSSGTVDL